MLAYPLVAEPLGDLSQLSHITINFMEVSLHKHLLAPYCGHRHAYVNMWIPISGRDVEKM